MQPKEIIGMIHLKAMPTSPKNEHTIEEIIQFAKMDLATLQKAGITKAIVENVFDTPYVTELNLELIVAYTHIFTVLQQEAQIELGVNLHATSGVEEMVIATLCGASFIRAESFVEPRSTMSGYLKPMAANLMRKKKELGSDVKIFADVNVKESRAVINQSIDVSIAESLAAGADAIIVTGLATGKPPSEEEVKALKQLVGDKPLLLGSGINESNAKTLFKYADGAIIGSSIKEDGIIENKVSLERTENLLRSLS